jgi:WD40 repeat protein
MPQFINNDMLAVYTPTNIQLMERGGKVRFAQTFDVANKWIDEFGRPVRSSANGQRFAVASNALHLRGVKDESFAIHVSTGDIPAEFPLDVQIYDLSAAQWIYTLQINADHLRQIWGLALSPNGNNLAIDSGGTIQVFSVPPSPFAASPK